MKRLSIPIKADAHRTIKLAALTRDQSVTRFVLEAVQRELRIVNQGANVDFPPPVQTGIDPS